MIFGCVLVFGGELELFIWRPAFYYLKSDKHLKTYLIVLNPDISPSFKVALNFFCCFSRAYVSEKHFQNTYFDCWGLFGFQFKSLCHHQNNTIISINAEYKGVRWIFNLEIQATGFNLHTYSFEVGNGSQHFSFAASLKFALAIC